MLTSADIMRMCGITEEEHGTSTRADPGIGCSSGA